jgi:hypothetical protein
MHAAASPWPRAPVGQDFPLGRPAAEIWRLGDACFLCKSALQRGVSIEQDPEWMQGKAGTERYRCAAQTMGRMRSQPRSVKRAS